MGQTNFSALKHFSVKAYFKGERKMCHIIKQLMTGYQDLLTQE